MTVTLKKKAGFTVLSLCASSVFIATPAMAGPQLPSALPPVANAGECYARVSVPAQYSQSSLRMVSQDGYTDLDVRQPQLRSRTEQVMVKEPSVQYRVRQPTFRTITEQLVVTPAHERLSVRPPQFSSVSERLQTGAPHLIWKRGNPGELMAQGYKIHSTADGGRLVQGRAGGSGQGYRSTSDYAANGGDRCGPGCEIWCLVEEPGTFVTTTRRIVARPAEILRTAVPEQRQSITKQILADRGGVEEIPVPGQFRSVIINDIVDPGGIIERQVPEQYSDVSTRTLISPERYEWRRVLCQPGTGSIGQASSQHSSGRYSSAGGYATGQSNSYSRGYTSGASTVTDMTTQRTYSGMGYGDDSAVFSSGSMMEPTSQSQGVSSQNYDTKTGYYGTEDYPAYRGPSRPRR